MTSSMKANWFYLFVLLLFFFMIFVTIRYFRGSRHSMVGITNVSEHKINAEKPALVKTIKVNSGQQVKNGDLLIALTSTAMEIEIAKLNNRINALRSEKTERAKLAQSEIAFVRANEGIAIEKVNNDIVQAESEMVLNKKLTRDFIAAGDSASEDQPVALKLNALKRQRMRQEEAVSIKVKDILQEDDTEQRLLTNQIDLLERELQLLISEQKSLNKYAAADGVVENIFVREGEQVDAFTPLLSLNLVHPVAVVGYQVGEKEGLNIGSNVTIRSFNQPSLLIKGKIIGYGAVVELPEILQKSTAVKSFGREVFIEIPTENEFAAGEKVLIR
jgi:multidrug resistance efflux pump